MNARLLLFASVLLLATGLIVAVSCVENVRCKLCDEGGTVDRECDNLARAMYGCDIALSDLSFDSAVYSCTELKSDALAACYFGCYAENFRCTFWEDCIDNCEDTYPPWPELEPDDDDDSVGDDDDDAPAPIGDCLTYYAWLYDECQMTFLDEFGDEMGLDEVVALCDSVDPDFSGDILDCLIIADGDCGTVVECLTALFS
jgi:hypothetical protein